MGIPPRLNGNSIPLPSDKTGFCLECGREVYHIELEQIGNEVIKTCPNCGVEITSTNFIYSKKDKPR